MYSTAAVTRAGALPLPESLKRFRRSLRYARGAGHGPNAQLASILEGIAGLLASEFDYDANDRTNTGLALRLLIAISARMATDSNGCEKNC